MNHWKNISKIMLIIIMTFLLQSCNRQEKIPKELKISFEYLDQNWNATAIETFKNISENDTTPRNYHFGIGMHLRNNLLRHHEESKNITKFFDSLGIQHYDDMSSIILTSYYRNLNQKNIKLKEQVTSYKAYWKPIFECEEKQKERAFAMYAKYRIGDTLTIKIPVNDANNGYDLNCPNIEWNFDKLKDLSMKVVLMNKHKDSLYDKAQFFFDVQILERNYITPLIFMNDAQIGEEFNVNLNTSWKIQ
ncbi:DUF6794 domain-containing protein [uncultured Kordia sp.]|uniref:DUF6794 domain-containing protein n=1 Tax=uncultured Kordia sp. TaxID=507699 RepID=UPI00261903A8|nr:DUF6794 domain-containing protein [uncultured Kordia sp.]